VTGKQVSGRFAPYHWGPDLANSTVKNLRRHHEESSADHDICRNFANCVPCVCAESHFDLDLLARDLLSYQVRTKADAFWKNFRENTKPIFEEFKKAGLISDYKTFTNPVTIVRATGTSRYRFPIKLCSDDKLAAKGHHRP